jgi:hypothetical protein
MNANTLQKMESIGPNEFELARLKLDQLKKEGANICMSTAFPDKDTTYGVYAPKWLKVDIALDSEIKDVYKPKDKWRLHARGLRKIAREGDVKWSPEESGYTSETRKFEGTTGTFIVFRSVASVTGPDGTPITKSGYYDFDPLAMRSKIKAEYDEKAKAWENQKDAWFKNKTADQKKAYIDGLISRDYIQKETNALRSCQTGSENRAIKGLYGLPEEFGEGQIQKPFWVLRWEIKIDYSDPETRQMLQRSKMAAMLGIYGAGSGQQQICAPINTRISGNISGSLSNDPNIQPLPADPDDPDDISDPMDEATQYQSGSEDERRAMRREDFLLADKDNQIRTVEALIKIKAFQVTWKSPLSALDGPRMLGLYDKLMEMPDAVVTDDFPF